MKLVPVEALPGKRLRHRLQDLIKEFVESNAEIVKVDFNEHDYVSAKVCRSCLGVAIKTSQKIEPAMALFFFTEVVLTKSNSYPRIAVERR